MATVTQVRIPLLCMQHTALSLLDLKVLVCVFQNLSFAEAMNEWWLRWSNSCFRIVVSLSLSLSLIL